MDLKTENTPGVPEAREDLDGIPAHLAEKMTPEDLALAKEVIRLLRKRWEENPEREARWAATIERACEEGLM